MKQFIKSDKFILFIFGVIGVLLVVILIMVVMRKNQLTVSTVQSGGSPISQQNSTTSSNHINQTNQPFNLFAWIFPHPQSNPGQSNQTTSQGSSVAQNGNTQTTQSNGQEKIVPTPISRQLGQNIGGASSTGSNVTNNNILSNPNATQFQIVFLGPDGQLTTYVPPSTPPIQVTWARYTDPIDHFSVDYPSNWQLKTQDTNGHTGISLFLPNANIQDPNQQYVGFGWSNYNLFPANDLTSQSYATPATVTGISGTLYTHGAIGNSYIITIFPYNSGYFGIGSTASDPAFAYVYQHMLSSLTFNQQ